MSAKEPAVWFVGGGELGLHALRTARELGLATIVADRDPNALGFALADANVVEDGADADVQAGYVPALSSRYRIVGAHCGAEFGLETVRRIRVEAGLAALPRVVLARTLDKRAQKRTLEAAGIPTPHALEARVAGDLRELVADGGRAVLKPAGGSGSRGVRMVDASCDLVAEIDACRASVAGETTVLAEPFVVGRSIDVNGIVRAGELLRAGVLEKFETPAPARLPVGGEDPADLTAAERDEAYALLARAAEALGIDEGPVKGDLLLGEDGFTVLELAPRLHGDVTTCGTLPYGTGIDPLRFLLSDWAGEPDHAALEPSGRGVAVWRVLALPPGRVRRIELPHLGDGVTLAWHNPRTAERIERYGDTTRIPGYVCGHGRDRAAAEAACAAWLERAVLDVDADPEHADWYEALGAGLRRAGIDPASAGHRG